MPDVTVTLNKKALLRVKLQDLVTKTGIKELAIIINGTYLTSSSKMVYISYENENKDGEEDIYFYVKSSSDSDDPIKRLPSMLRTILEKLLDTELYGIDLGINFSLQNCSFKIDQELGLIILESGIYSLVKDIAMTKNFSSSDFNFKGEILEKYKVNQLVLKFREESYDNYKSVIFSKISNRFISKLLNQSKFYKIMKSFVPVFVHYDFLYDPLRDNPDLNIEMYSIVKTAKKLDRKPTNLEHLSCYFMTHKEICTCFGLSHFIRFTPSFAYELFVGLLNPSFRYYPNVLNEAFVKPRTSNNSVRGCFLKNEYFQMVYSLNQILDPKNASNYKDSEKQYAHDQLDILSSYLNSNTLYYACIKNRDYLLNYGPSILDDKENTSVDALYSYLSEAKLLID